MLFCSYGAERQCLAQKWIKWKCLEMKPVPLTKGVQVQLARPVATAKSLQSCPTLSDPRRQPTRLPRPWDSPGKNTGVGCHCLLQCMKVKSESEVAQSCPTLSDPLDGSPPGSPIHGIFQARGLEWGAIAFSGVSSYKGTNPIIRTPPYDLI